MTYASGVVEAISQLSLLEGWLIAKGEVELARRAGLASARLRALCLDAELDDEID